MNTILVGLTLELIVIRIQFTTKTISDSFSLFFKICLTAKYYFGHHRFIRNEYKINTRKPSNNLQRQGSGKEQESVKRDSDG